MRGGGALANYRVNPNNAFLTEKDKLISTDSAIDSKATSDTIEDLNLAKSSLEEGSSKPLDRI